MDIPVTLRTRGVLEGGIGTPEKVRAGMEN